MRDLTIEGKIVIFKSLASGFDKDCAYFWQGKKKHSTLCSSYENVDLKDVDIFYIK